VGGNRYWTEGGKPGYPGRMGSTGAFELPNGMRFIVAEDHACPVAAVGLWAMAGVPDEPAERRGIAHLFEHMMFRGSAHVGPAEHSRRIEAVGGKFNAGTGIDTTVYHDTVPSDAVEEVFRLEADRFRHLALTDEHLDVERKVVLEELHVYENQPMVKAMRQIHRRIGQGHPYGLDPLGRSEDLENTTRDDLEAFYRKCYRPERVFGVVAGDVTAGQVRELAERHFGQWQAAPEAAPAEPVGSFMPLTGELALRVPFQVPVMTAVHRLPPPAEGDRPAVKVLAGMLTQGKTSLIREALVERTRLCIEAGAMMIEGRLGGVLVAFGAFLPPGSHARRRRVLREVCGKLAADGPDADRLARTVKQARRDRADEQYDPQRRMFQLGSAQALTGDWRTYQDELEELAQVTPDRVRAVAAELFAADSTLALDVTPERMRWWMWPVGIASKLWRR